MPRAQARGTLAVGELAQELAERGRRAYLAEQPGHPAGADQVQIVDTVRPAAIPAKIEVILRAGFTPVDFTRVAPITTLLEISSDNPACSASAITGTNPEHDTRFSSSNENWARAQPSGQLHRQCLLGPR